MRVKRPENLSGLAAYKRAILRIIERFDAPSSIDKRLSFKSNASKEKGSARQRNKSQPQNLFSWISQKLEVFFVDAKVRQFSNDPI
jgi:hypothetical protein